MGGLRITHCLSLALAFAAMLTWDTGPDSAFSFEARGKKERPVKALGAINDGGVG